MFTLLKLRIFFTNRILIIDDEEFCITALKQMLQISGVDVSKVVDSCLSGFKAIQMVEQAYANGCSYRLIFTDFSMPEIDGFETCRRIRDHLTNRANLSLEQQPAILGVTGHVGE